MRRLWDIADLPVEVSIRGSKGVLKSLARIMHPFAKASSLLKTSGNLIVVRGVYVR